MAGLASLTANYTDSEEENEEEEENVSEPFAKAPQERPPSVLDRLKEKSASGTPGSGSNPASNRSTPTKKTALVAYQEEGEDAEHGAAASALAEEPKKDIEDSDGDVVSMDLDSDNAGFDEAEEDQDKAEQEAKEGASKKGE